MFKTGMISLAATAALMMTGCSAEGDKTTTAADDTHVVQPITITTTGILADQDGTALANQTVTVNGVSVVTGADGSFTASATVYPDVEGTGAGGANNLAISVANFSVTDATAGTTTNYLGLTTGTNVVVQATGGLGVANGDNVLVQNLNGATFNAGILNVSALDQAFSAHVKDATTGVALANKTLVITENSATINFATTVTTDANGDFNVSAFPNIPAGLTYNIDTAGYTANTFTLSDDREAVKFDISLTMNDVSSTGDTTAPDFDSFGDELTNAGTYGNLGSGAVWLSPSVDGSSANPLVVNFTEAVTVAAGAIEVMWAEYDAAAYSTAQDAVDTAEEAYLAAIETALEKKVTLANSVKDIQNYLATDSNTTDNNSTGDATFKTKWDTYIAALAAYETELEKLGNDLQTDASTSTLTDADGTTIAGVIFTQLVCDSNSSMYVTTPVASCTGTYTISNANAIPAQAENAIDDTVAETTLGKALATANATIAALDDQLAWNVPETVTVTATPSGDSVELVTSPTLPDSDTAGGTITVRVDVKKTGVTDAAGNYMSITNQNDFTGMYYLNIAD